MNIAFFRSALGSFALISSAALVLLVPAARAQQQQSSLHLVVKIPFAFEINSQSMPPDTYDVRRFTNNSIVLLGQRSHDSGIVAIRSTTEIRQPDHASLFFRRYGDQYFLLRILSTGNRIAMDCAQSRAEKQAAHAQALLTKQQAAPTSVEVALTQ